METVERRHPGYTDFYSSITLNNTSDFMREFDLKKLFVLIHSEDNEEITKERLDCETETWGGDLLPTDEIEPQFDENIIDERLSVDEEVNGLEKEFVDQKVEVQDIIVEKTEREKIKSYERGSRKWN